MKRKKKKYSLIQLGASCFMMLALLCLTVSLPFVYEIQQRLAKHITTEEGASPLAANEEETANPFAGSSEEKKCGSNTSFSEEYLHDHHEADNFFLIARQYYKNENADTYTAFHGELLVPPPNAA